MASNGNSQESHSQSQGENSQGNLDPIWTSSRTARQIYALGEVEKDIGRLLSLAASSISLLTLPQTDAPEDKLPQGEERSEQFVLEVSEYFERLDNIQIAMRSSLAHIRQSRIAPSAIDAPPPNFVPSALGVGLPPTGSSASGSQRTEGTAAGESESQPKARGLQEERVERDAWTGLLEALTKLRDARNAGDEAMDTAGDAA